jgi:catechol 2,3-dioxygenase-like lactoylglutathione lyase family enzyme
MIDHITLQVSDVPVSRAFYETVLEPLGIAPGATDGTAVGFFGPEPGSFWLCPAQRAEDREVHIAFRASCRDAVRAFHEAAVGAGAEVLHAPRLFPEYHDDYYGAFVRDPDGHNIEAVCHEPGTDRL